MWKTNNSINDSKLRKRKLALSCSKKTIGITKRNNFKVIFGDFYCLNCFHSFRTKNILKTREKVCKNKDFCGIVMPSEKNNILEFDQKFCGKIIVKKLTKSKNYWKVRDHCHYTGKDRGATHSICN